MTEITARARFQGHDLTDIPVLNPGGWFGKTWLLEIGGSYWPLFLVVEADSATDAIDELAESGKYGSHLVVAAEDIGDYPEEDRHYSATGKVLDLDHLMIHGQEGVECPFACTYYGGDLPPEGMKPTDCWPRED
jgi:hypothetical protein